MQENEIMLYKDDEGRLALCKSCTKEEFDKAVNEAVKK